jgi:hypothetical protein
VYNSLPAAPLDGGRLLRAFVWWRTRDRTRAALTAAAAGRGLGWVLVGGGTLLIFLTGSFNGLWFALMGWFLVAAATAESRQTQVQTLLAGVRAGQIMTPDPEPVSASMTVGWFLNEDPLRHHYSAFPLTTGDPTPIGLVTPERLRSVQPSARDDVRLRDVMYPLDQVAVAGPDDPAADLLPRLSAAPSHHALILEEGRLVGMVSPADVNRVLRWAEANRR